MPWEAARMANCHKPTPQVHAQSVSHHCSFIDPVLMPDVAKDTELPVERQHLIGGELLMLALLELLVVRIAYRIDRSKRVPYLSAAAWAIVLGIFSGLLLTLVSKDRVKDAGINPQVIFFGLLPPIILEAGFTMEHRGFFANFWDSFLLGIFGTVLSTLAIALALYWLGHTSFLSTALGPAEALQYGSLISAIDPVASQLVLRKSHVPSLLPELVFGERSLNNAFTVAIFNLCQEIVLRADTRLSFSSSLQILASLTAIGAGSMLLAALVGYSSAYFLRNSDDALKQHPTYEISILLLFAYSSYLAGEFFHLSGHLTVFFSGAFIRHYHLHNISRSSATTFRQLLRTMAFLAENFIFIYLGLSLFAYSDTFDWDWSFILVSFAVCLVVRALTTFPLCYAAGLWRVHPIPLQYMVVIWLSGLRGAVAFGLSLNVHPREGANDHSPVIRSATLFMVISTTIVFTFVMGPLVQCLGLADTCQAHMYARHPKEQTPLVLSPGSEQEASWIRDAWSDFDERHLQPHFGHGTDPDDVPKTDDSQRAPHKTPRAANVA